MLNDKNILNIIYNSIISDISGETTKEDMQVMPKSTDKMSTAQEKSD